MHPASGSAPSIGLRELWGFMTPNPVIVDRETTLDEALGRLERYGFRHLPVVECNRVLGMLSDRDLRMATGLLPREQRPTVPGEGGFRAPESVGEVMRTPVHCLPEQARAREAAECMLRHEIGAVPVVAGEVLVGIVTATDLLRLLTEHGAEGSDETVDRHLLPLASVAPDTRIVDAFARLDPRVRHLAVSADGPLLGIVSERDLSAGLTRSVLQNEMAAAHGGHRRAPSQVSEVMTPRVIVVEPGTPLWRCAARMLDHRISALPVCANERLQGVLTQRALLEHFARIAAGGADA